MKSFESIQADRAWRLPARAILAALCLLVINGGVASAATVRDLCLEGKRLADGGDPSGAFTALHDAARMLSEQVNLDREVADYLSLNLFNLGVQFNNSGKPADAMTCFTDALGINARAHGVRDAAFQQRLRDAGLSVAEFLISARRPDATLAALQLLASGAEEDTRVLLASGAARLALQHPDEALQFYERAAASDPNSAEASAGAARATLQMALSGLNQTGGPARNASLDQPIAEAESAIDLLTRACNLQPASSGYQRELAAALVSFAGLLSRSGDVGQSVERTAQAESAFHRSVEIDAASPWPRLDLASFLFHGRRYQESLRLFQDAQGRFEALVAARPSDRNASAWKSGAQACRENSAASSYNLAVDAVNEARFADVEPLLAPVCGVSPSWELTCVSFRRVAQARAAAFQDAIRQHQESLAEDPSRAADILALGDLYEQVGDDDNALRFYERLKSIGSDVPGLQDRIAAVRKMPDTEPVRRTVVLSHGKVELSLPAAARATDLETAVKAAALRVEAILGQDALAGSFSITVFVNKRAFREKAGYRVGSTVLGFYGPGRVSVYDAPSRTVVDWVSVLTHEMTHHVVERLSGGSAPRWFSEGVARYVEGDTALVDRARLKRRLAANALQPLAGLDLQMDRGWNDPEIAADARDQALLAVAQIARRVSAAGLKEILLALANGAELDAAVRKVAGVDLAVIDASWQASLL